MRVWCELCKVKNHKKIVRAFVRTLKYSLPLDRYLISKYYEYRNRIKTLFVRSSRLAALDLAPSVCARSLHTAP